MATLLAENLNPNSDESDEDDDDYVPSGGEESEDDLPEAEPEELATDDQNVKQTKRRRNSKATARKKSNGVRSGDRGGHATDPPRPIHIPGKRASRKRKGGIRLSDNKDDVNHDDEAAVEEDVKQNPEEGKKKADDLWADFLSDVTPPPKKTFRPSSCTPTGTTVFSPVKSASKAEKVTITKVFEFAGESVVVKEQVDANSKAAKEFEEASSKTPTSDTTTSSQKTPLSSKKGGVSAILGKVLEKKSRLSTLEKSKLDWNSFKREEGVEEDLEQYKKGKGGYLERQAFLERADIRQFEIEKQLRTINRSHRT